MASGIRPKISKDVRSRMGIYKTIEEVPDKYRLGNYSAEYEDRDVWGEYVGEKTAIFDSKSTLNRYEKAGRYFKTYMNEAGRHHALATPEHIEGFLIAIRDGDVGRHHHPRKIQTVYFEYFQPIEGFYSWLQWNANHPHVYHPVWMAVAEGGVAREAWIRKLETNDKR